MINYKIESGIEPIGKIKSCFHYHDYGYVPFINKEVIDHHNSDLKYQLNDFGFRSYESYSSLFKRNQEYIACIGCSHTRGDGLFFDETWPYLLGKQLNLPVMNLGLTGGTVEYCRYQLQKLLEDNNRCKPKYIFVLQPPTNRYAILNEDEYTFFQDWNFIKYDNMSVEGNLIFKFGVDNKNMNEIKVISYVDSLSKKFNILHQINEINLKNYIKNTKNVFLIQWDLFGEDWPKAKDDMHYDISYSKKISSEFLKKLTSNLI